MSNTYSQKLNDSDTQSIKHAVKTASKKSFQKNSRSNWCLIDNKIADKITKASKRLHSKTSQNNLDEGKNETKKRKIYISRKKAINYWWIKGSVILYNNGISEIINLLDNASNQLS